MANYYDVLKMDPSASSQVIEEAIDQQYNQWRRLTTHHDSVVVNQANQALTLIEKIRFTLTDHERREIYDTAIGIKKQKIDGLIDPTIEPHLDTLVPPLNHLEKKPSYSTGQSWLCQKCGSVNQPESKFCELCGNLIGTECPQCKKVVWLGSKFCRNCGCKVEIKKQEKHPDEPSHFGTQDASYLMKKRWAKDVITQLIQKRGKQNNFRLLLTYGLNQLQILGIIIRELFENPSSSLKSFKVKTKDLASGYVYAIRPFCGISDLDNIEVFVEASSDPIKLILIFCSGLGASDQALDFIVNELKIKAGSSFKDFNNVTD